MQASAAISQLLRGRDRSAGYNRRVLELRRGRTTQRRVQGPWVGGMEQRMSSAKRETGNERQKVGKGRRGN